MDIATWNASDRLFHRQLAAMTGNPVLLAFADHVAVADGPAAVAAAARRLDRRSPAAPASTWPSTA